MFDISRKFYKHYSSPGIINLSEHSQSVPYSEIFVEQYNAIQKENPDLSDEEIFPLIESKLKEKGIYLVKEERPEVRGNFEIKYSLSI